MDAAMVAKKKKKKASGAKKKGAASYCTTPEDLAPFGFNMRDLVRTPLGVVGTVLGVKCVHALPCSTIARNSDPPLSQKEFVTASV